jgi:hypothetical protein
MQALDNGIALLLSIDLPDDALIDGFGRAKHGRQSKVGLVVLAHCLQLLGDGFKQCNDVKIGINKTVVFKTLVFHAMHGLLVFVYFVTWDMIFIIVVWCRDVCIVEHLITEGVST